MMSASDTRQRILDATQRLIETVGSAGLTTKEIAREAGCAEGTLFKHFNRKEDLCLAVVLENSPKLRETIAQIGPGESTVAENLADMALAATRFFERLIPLAASLLADTDLLARHRQQMHERQRGPQDVFELVVSYIEAEQGLHRIGRNIAPASAAALLLGPCFQRVFIRQVMGKDLFPSTDKDFIASLIATLLHGLTPSDDPGRGRKRTPQRK